MKAPKSKPARYVSAEERAWLDNIIRQLKFDERMQAERERWLFERPRIRAS